MFILNPRLEGYIHATKIHATKFRSQKAVSMNFSIRQQQALINKADKGSTMAIQDKQDYTWQGLKHLSVTHTYLELDRDTTKEVADYVVETVRPWYQDGIIDKPTAE